MKKKKGKRLLNIGKTPLFDYESPSDVEYVFPNDETVYPVERCGLEWVDPLMKRIPVVNQFLPQAITSSKLNPLNIVKGGKFECSYIVRKELMKKNESIKAGCRSYLVMPPPHESEKVSEKIKLSWKEKNFATFKGRCDQIIESKFSKTLLDYLGENHLNRYYGIEYLLYGKIAKTGYQMKATHLVFLEAKETEDKISIQPKIYDIHRKTRSESKLERSYTIANKKEKRSLIAGSFAKGFRLIPNTIALKFKFHQSLHLQNEENEQLYPTKDRAFNLLPTLRLTNVDYPEDKWAINFRYSPSFSYKSWDQQYEIKFVTGVLALKLFAHTPIGTFQTRFGFGGGYVDIKALESDYQQGEWSPVWQYGLEFYKIFSERLFLNIGWRKTHFTKNNIKDEEFELDGYSHWFLGVGYFFPEFKLKVSKWLAH